jgi:tetratricopeptide (TPR) repeat protein
MITDSSGVQVGDYNRQTNIGVDAATLPTAPVDGGVTHNLPPVSAVFEGRDLAELDRLLAGVDGGVVVGQAAMHGLGGIGKSELANQYARAYLGRYRLVWWITAENPQAVDLGLAALTARLHPVATLVDAQEWARGWLQSNSGWLLILDNVEAITDITDLLGQLGGRGHIVVTTRRSLGDAQWRRLGLTPLRLEVLERAASVRLLVELTGLTDPAGADLLADRLGDLPLGLQQAAAYISQHNGMTFVEYRRLLVEEFDRTAADLGPGETGLRTIAVVWTVTMTSVNERSPLAASILDVLAWLGADPLPVVVLEPAAESPRDLADALAVLESYSMIIRRSGIVSTHRLVQAVTRSKATAADRARQVRDTAIGLLLLAIPDDPANNVAGFPMWAGLLPHIQAIVELMPPGEDSDGLLFLRERAATYQQHQGSHGTAVSTFDEVVASRERLFGPEHPETLVARSNLANSYWSAGRTAEAIVIEKSVASDRERLLGPEHPDTLTSWANLGTSYSSAGRIAEAIDLLEKVAADSRRLLGREHPSTLIAQANLATTYRFAGRTAEAIALLEQVVADRDRLLGTEHPLALTTWANLATSLRSAGRTAEAIAIEEKVVADMERLLGVEHPNTLTAKANLATSFESAGRTAEAIALLEKVVADMERLLGVEHPRTLTTWSNLATAYSSAARITEAIALLERIAADSERLLGPEHPDTLTTQANLAIPYQSAGRTAEAITLLKKVADDSEHVLGRDHPKTLTAQVNLATSYLSAGRITAAIALLEQASAQSERLLGPEHPDTLAARANLAVSYRSAGQVTEAVALLETVVADMERLLGPEHPTTLTTWFHLADSYRSAGRIAEAIDLLGKVADDRDRLLGRGHPTTVAAFQVLQAWRIAGGLHLSIYVASYRSTGLILLA